MSKAALKNAEADVKGDAIFNSSFHLTGQLQVIRVISNRLFVALLVMLGIAEIGNYPAWNDSRRAAGDPSRAMHQLFILL